MYVGLGSCIGTMALASNLDECIVEQAEVQEVDACLFATAPSRQQLLREGYTSYIDGWMSSSKHIKDGWMSSSKHIKDGWMHRAVTFSSDRRTCPSTVTSGVDKSLPASPGREVVTHLRCSERWTTAPKAFRDRNLWTIHARVS